MLEEHISTVGIQFSSYLSAGVYKKQSFGHRGGEINSYFDFLGKIN